jgi:hypothetical protein
MITVFSHDTTTFNNNGLCTLIEAEKVCIKRVINGEYLLSFEMPLNNSKWQYIKRSNIVLCDGQIYRILKKSREKTNNISCKVECMQIAMIDGSEKKLMLSYGPVIGDIPYNIMVNIYKETNINIMTTAQVEALGMKWIADKTDIFATQLVSPLDITKKLIENIGRGELYIDNYNIALVERIGKDTNVLLNSNTNLSSINDIDDGSNVITRLYPLGNNDFTIENLNKTDGNIIYRDGYIESISGVAKYGVVMGYKKYDVSEKETTPKTVLLNKALYDFDSSNQKRLDDTNNSITVNYIDLNKIDSRFAKLYLGDSIVIKDGSFNINSIKRITSMEYYPFSGDEGNITLGIPSKTLIDVIKDVNQTTTSYNNTLTESGKVKSTFIENILQSRQEQLAKDLLTYKLDEHKNGDIWYSGDSAIAIVNGKLAIATSRNNDNSFNWSTFIDGKSIDANLLNTGTLNTNLVNLISDSGNMSIKGDSLKMVAIDGTVVSLRSTDDSTVNPTYRKGLTVASKFDSFGKPTDYTIFDSNGQRRYIGGVRMPTYTISVNGTIDVGGIGGGYTTSSTKGCYAYTNYISWSYLYLEDDTLNGYWYNLANQHTSIRNGTNANKQSILKKMLQCTVLSNPGKGYFNTSWRVTSVLSEQFNIFETDSYGNPLIQPMVPSTRLNYYYTTNNSSNNNDWFSADKKGAYIRCALYTEHSTMYTISNSNGGTTTFSSGTYTSKNTNAKYIVNSTLDLDI